MADVNSVLDERIEIVDLERAREAFIKDRSSAAAAFVFAHAATRSPLTEDVKEAIQVLERLVVRGGDVDVGEPTSRDCVYTLALAHARLKQYDRALAYLDTLLTHESNNRQAANLRAVIKEKMRQDGLWGAAILAGGAAVVGGLLFMAARATRK